MSTFTVGRGRIVGAGSDWSVTCGGCGDCFTLPRGVTTGQEARREARVDGFGYLDPWGWVCPSCRHGWAGLPPSPEPPGPRPDPRRRVLVVVDRPRSRDGGHPLAARGELLECGHIVIHPGGAVSHNRTRRCPDCGWAMV